jgi:cytochrome c-type biogenesis protein CcmE
MKPKYIIGAIIAIALVVTALVSVDSKKIEYMDFHAATESGSRAQISGHWVKDGGCSYDANANEFHFTMQDSAGVAMPVVLKGAKPNNFEVASQIVATGHVENGVFQATNVLTKCPSKYESSASDLGT